MQSRIGEYVVAIIGGATAGAEAAGVLAARGVQCVVFEQNLRPYGKIENGLPRWHAKLRQKEYATINQHLAHPNVHFVPSTKIGRDVQFKAIARDWGFTAVLLAHGAWRDRPMPIAGADEYVDRGLIYQNSLIHWFNHYPERGYDGPRYQMADGAIVLGGGLASIDVVKVLQIELVQQALAKRGINEDVLHIEHAGIPELLAGHGLSWEELGLRGTTLFYRRRIEDMPLTESGDEADESRRAKLETTRRRILEKAMQKYCFRVRAQMMPVGLIVEGNHLVGLRLQRTCVEGGRAMPVPGEISEVHAPLIVSSIGSIPESIDGIDEEGGLYRYTDSDLGRLEGYETVFSTGNVVTGKGNILVSRKHSIKVSAHLAEKFLGLGDHAGEEELLDAGQQRSAARAGQMAAWVETRPLLSPEQARRILARVNARQREVGYTGSYREWIARVTPPDLA